MLVLLSKVPDALYVYKFQATGCPNPKPNIDWWKTILKGNMFQDMLAYCNVVKNGQASPGQISHCCGSIACSPTWCHKQTSWKQGKWTHYNYKCEIIVKIHRCNLSRTLNIKSKYCSKL